MRFPATSINTVLWPIIVIFMDEYSGAVVRLSRIVGASAAVFQ
jgi:hypothetical protein